MLILPPGHAETLRAPRRVTGCERVIVAGVAGVAVALLIAVLLSIGSAGHTTGRGCVDVKFPIAIGGQEIYDCGTRARELCASVGQPRGATGVEGQAVAVQCRRAGLPVG